MTVRFTRQANNQLGTILEYLRDKDPRSADKVARAIEHACDQIADHPELGRRQDVEGVRRRVVLPSGYLIYYSVSSEDRAILIIAILHPAQRRSYNDA